MGTPTTTTQGMRSGLAKPLNRPTPSTKFPSETPSLRVKRTCTAELSSAERPTHCSGSCRRVTTRPPWSTTSSEEFSGSSARRSPSWSRKRPTEAATTPTGFPVSSHSGVVTTSRRRLSRPRVKASVTSVPAERRVRTRRLASLRRDPLPPPSGCGPASWRRIGFHSRGGASTSSVKSWSLWGCSLRLTLGTRLGLPPAPRCPRPARRRSR